MNRVLNNFFTIAKVARCSYKTKKMQDFLVNFAKELNYKHLVDNNGNILIFKEKPKISLQAHYDMVCVGDAPNIELIKEGNILRAKNSTLGADNGIAIAIMMALMQDGVDAEFLFTNDEEVGLIGAKNLELLITSKYLLNLDSEDEAEVYIGCAGGADIVANFKDELVEVSGDIYELSLLNLPGGHSGVDIDKNILSAIKLLSNYLKENKIEALISIEAGERRNSIPANAKAIVVSKDRLIPNSDVKVKELNINKKAFKSSKVILDLIDKLPHGVISYNKEFNVPQTSVNLAQINSKDGQIEFIVTPRAMSDDSLDMIVNEISDIFKKSNFNIKIEDKYPAWKPEINDFTKLVEKEIKKLFGKSSQKVIHAGLECGVLSKKLKDVKFASIGPNIRYPHSKREYVELDSVDKTYKVVKEIIKAVNSF